MNVFECLSNQSKAVFKIVPNEMTRDRSSDYANFGYLFIIILSLFIYHRREATLTAYFFCSPVRISNMTFSSLAR